MIATEFKMEDAIEVWKEEGREEGIVIGEERGEAKGEAKGEANVISLLESGYSLAEVKAMLQKRSESQNE